MSLPAPPPPLEIRKPRTAHDFPRGFSEAGSGIGPRLLFDLPYGKTYDAGLAHYGEFYANLEYGWDLLHMPVVKLDGRPGTVKVVARFENGVQMAWRAA